MGNKYTKEDLKIMQSWPLERKIRVTQTRIIEWYQRFEGKVYVSFSETLEPEESEGLECYKRTPYSE